MKRNMLDYAHALCHYVRRSHVVINFAVILLASMCTPRYDSISVFTCASNRRFSRCLSNVDEQINKPHLRENSTTPNNFAGVYFKLDDNYDMNTLKPFINVEGKPKAMSTFSEESKQYIPASDELKELNNDSKELNEHKDNYYEMNEFMKILQVPEIDASAHYFSNSILDIPKKQFQTNQNGESDSIVSEDEQENLNERISSLRMKCSHLRNELSEDEVNVLISHLDNDSTIKELSNLWWQLRSIERIYYISVIKELKDFYKFLIMYFRLKEDESTKKIWKMVKLRKILHDLVDEEREYNKSFYEIIKSKSQIIDEIKNLINKSRDSLNKIRTETLDFYANKFIEEMKYEYYSQKEKSGASIPLETNKEIIMVYIESHK